ncbi:MAG: hypothetical protein ACRESK_00655 [Gammaproteobacteria bacterium]
MPLFSFRQARERPIRDVPISVLFLLVVMLALQIAWHAGRTPPVATAGDLPVPPPLEKLQVFSLGDHSALSRMLMLWLQAYANRPGISIPYRELDYPTVISWLEVILALDGRGQYPLLAASRLYSEVPDEARQRQMLEFVYRKFLEEPDRRWPALAHAVFMAKHRLKDLPLALRYARALTERVTSPLAPYWVRQMQAWVLEDMGELEDARILLGGLVESGTIRDPHELLFLKQRLRQLETEEEKMKQGDPSNRYSPE